MKGAIHHHMLEDWAEERDSRMDSAYPETLTRPQTYRRDAIKLGEDPP